jgi:serine/threonine-protein kinase
MNASANDWPIKSEVAMRSELAEPLDQVLADYFKAADAGRPPPREELLGRHPDLAAQLEEFFLGLDQAESWIKPVREVADAMTLAWKGELDSEEAAPGSFGDYEQLEEIGRGGMGVVYKAWDKGLKRWVALKTVRAGQLASPEDAERFRGDSQKAAHLDHPNIVPVFHSGEAQGECFFTMKLIDGKNLKDYLADKASVERSTRKYQGEAAELMIKVARAVHFAHDRALIHCDIKPHNILIDVNNKPFLTDFGLAKRIAGNDADPAIAAAIEGTLPYMAPERAAGDTVLPTRSVDVFGLGATLYWMLSGQPPFPGQSDSTRSWIARVRHGEIVSLESLNPDVNADLALICHHCLQKAPDNRYSSAKMVADDLENWLHDRPISIRQSSPIERFWLWCRRYPALALAVVLLLAVTVAAVTVARVRAARLEEETLRSNVYAAQGVASTVLWHLEHLSSPVLHMAEDQTVLDLMKKDDPASRAELQRYFHKQFDPKKPLGAINARLLRGQGDPAFQAMHAANTNGILVADTVDNPSVLGEDFSERDYFRGALAKKGARGRAAVHVSRVYRSKNDGLWKFAISTPVYDGPELDAPILGVVVANFATSPTLGPLRLNDGRRTAVVVCPKDPSTDETAPHFYSNNPSQTKPDEFLVLVHPAYNRGDKAIPVSSAQLQAVRRQAKGNEFELPDLRQATGPQQAMDRDYRDPMAAQDTGYAGRQLAGFAPVGNTEFVVIVQQRYDEGPADYGLWSPLIALIGVVTLLSAYVWSGHRRSRQTQV